MSWGGKRPGSGRHVATHTLAALEYRRTLIEEIIKEKLPIIRALIEKGKSGDVPALREINDRVVGRAEQLLDVTSGGEPLQICWMGNEDPDSVSSEESV